MRAIYTQNKNKVGKVDDVFGTISKSGIAIKPDEGVKAESFKAGDKVNIYIKFYKQKLILLNDNTPFKFDILTTI